MDTSKAVTAKKKRATATSSSARASGPKGGRLPGRPTRGAAPGLDRERILSAALARVDRKGVDSLSIRSLAADLGVAPNSLYSYVDGKDDLLCGVVEHVFGTLKVPLIEGPSWTNRCRDACRWLRSELLNHPNVITASAFPQTFPLGFVPFNYTLGVILHDEGFEDDELVQVMMSVFYHTVGFVILEVARSAHGLPAKSEEAVFKRAKRQLHATKDEELSQGLASVRNLNMDELFNSSLDALLEGLDARRERNIATPRRAKVRGGKS